jgi:hypothetical protein
MTWIYIPKCLCSPGTVGSVSASDWRDSPPVPSATSNGTNTASKSSKPGSKTATSMTLQSGTTSSPSTDDPGVESWIFSVLASLVNRIATPDSARAPMMTGTSGPIPSESLGRWDQDSSSWRTSQASLFDLTMDGQHMGAPWSESWPRSGMTRNGELFPLPTRVPHTSATGGGLWPTPRAIYGEHPGMRDLSHLTGMALKWPTPTSTERSGTNPNTGKGEGLSKTVRMFPTPRASEYKDTGPVGSKSYTHMLDRDYLCAVVKMLPTPKTRDRKGGMGTDPERQTHDLDKIVHLLPTPTSEDVYTGNMESSQQSDDSMHSVSLPDFVGRFPTPMADEGGARENTIGGGLRAMAKTGKWPTPNASSGGTHSGISAETAWSELAKGHQIGLGAAAAMWPTPSSGGDSGGPHGIRGGSWAKERLVETFGEEDAVAMSGGSLSPDWVSWLMGLPIKWTSLEPLPREEYLDWLHAQMDGTWWQEERGLPRVATGIKDRVNRLKCLGNGIVPASLALFLSSR